MHRSDIPVAARSPTHGIHVDSAQCPVDRIGPRPTPGVAGYIVLIVVEGIDGSGKSTLAAGLAAMLRARGRSVLTTCEPTDGPIGQRIRALAKSGRSAVTAEEEFQLFHQDRLAHVRDRVRPALAAGTIVIQDRSYFSTVAYQGERGLDRARLLALSEAIAPKPDVLLVVDVPVDVALARIARSRGAAPDDFEKKESLERVRQVFLALPGAAMIDGTAPPEEALKTAARIIAGADAVADPIADADPAADAALPIGQPAGYSEDG